jgi:hypothetical protein
VLVCSYILMRKGVTSTSDDSSLVHTVREFLERCYCSNISPEATPKVMSVSFLYSLFINVVKF